MRLDLFPWPAAVSVVLLLALPLATTGCAEDPQQLPVEQASPDEPLTLRVVDDGEGKHAVVVDPATSDNRVEDPETETATLEVGQGSCYYLARDGGPPSTLLLFPRSTSLQAGDPAGVVADGTLHPSGTLVSVTGEDVQLTAADNDQALPCLAAAGASFVTSISGLQEPAPSQSSSS